jgi:glycosyltransferase involved in cell wall biosynthesis
MIEHFPSAEHTVLLTPRRPHLGYSERRDGVAYLDPDGTAGFPGVLRKLIHVYRALQPDVVHAHSSYAGVFVRLAFPIPRARIVYSPHCYAFERSDYGRLRRALVRGVEAALAHRTGTLLAVSAHEATLGRSLSRSMRVVVGTNVPGVPDDLVASVRVPDPNKRLVVAGAGRLCEQKDPRFFAEVVRHAQGQDVPARWMWIGDGEPKLREVLEREGVMVTGWLSRGDALRSLASAHVYLHTAAWEGMPITVLEAAAVGLPVVVRSVPSTREMRIGLLVETPEEAAAEVAALASPSSWQRRAEESSAALRDLDVDRHLRRALVDAYRVTSGDLRQTSAPAAG